MTKTYRLSLIVLSLLVLLAVGFLLVGNFSFVLDHFWFTSGLLLLILLSLIDQPHFSKDSNIFVNAVTAGISLLLVPDVGRDTVYWSFFGATVYLLVSSYALLWIRQKPLAEEMPVVQIISRINREVGKPEAIFSAFFLWGAYKQFGGSTVEFDALLLYWIVFIVLNVPAIARAIEDALGKDRRNVQQHALGQIFGVQSKNTFLVKLYDSSIRTRKAKVFDFVEFQYSTDGRLRRGLILDIYLLNQEQWIKVLTSHEIEDIFSSHEPHVTHSLDIVYTVANAPPNNILSRLVGVVTEHSQISILKFIYDSKVPVSEGQLLEVTIDGATVLYQIIEGVTRIETLEQKNQTGLIVGEAIQLGTWNSEKLQFQQFGWVPKVNTPVFLARNIESPTFSDDEYIVGCIPNTNYPVVLNKTMAMSHHMAVIGVTGTGKSVFSRNLVREFLRDENTKVICIDFTGEYVGKFSDLAPCHTIAAGVSEQLFKDIDLIEREIANNYNKDTETSRTKKQEMSRKIRDEIKTFLEGTNPLSVFELPDVENTSGVLTYTKAFFRVLFHIAKKEKNYGKRVCLVLEEAHTVVPEWNFSGVSDKISQPLLNSIAQIALQGRKYGIGLLVIAQRTANVSKTILTQCNTIVSFQEFDKTSSDFLANYFGQDIVASLPKLKFRQAIAAGKAFRSSVPMIFEVPVITEEHSSKDPSADSEGAKPH